LDKEGAAFYRRSSGIDATAAAVAANGKIILPRCEIPTVGWLIKVQDPQGNVVCLKQLTLEHPESEPIISQDGLPARPF